MQFAGRQRELKLLGGRLDEIRSSGNGTLIAMRGRRRVGKSRLVDEFARRSGVPHVFYTAVQEPSEAELARFVMAVAESDVPASGLVRGGLRPESWEAALELVATGASPASPLIVVIDEFPYLVAKEPSIEAVLQKVWDRALERLPVLLLLIGSDEAMMEAVNDQGRPLYDRARELVIHPLTPADVADLLQLSARDALDAYLVIGGFPVLAQEWRAGRTRESYLAEALTDPTSFLVVSAERALAAEFPLANQAREVLGSIGAGSRAHKQLGLDTGLHATGLNTALASLQAKRVVERLTPYSTRSAPRTALWEIVDPYMRFWLRFVNRRIDLIERDRGQALVEDVKRSWPSFRGQAIEHLVRSSVTRMLPDPAFGSSTRHVGAYWNRAGTIQVDLVGGDRQPVARKLGFVGSVKWRLDAPFDRADALALAAQRAVVPGAAEQTRLIGVSARGFREAAALDARIGPDELLAAWR